MKFQGHTAKKKSSILTQIGRFQTVTVFEIALSTLVDIRSTNELTFGGPALILVDRRNMQ